MSAGSITQFTMTYGSIGKEVYLVCILSLGGVIVSVGSVTPNTQFTVTAESIVRKCGTIVGIHNYCKQGILVFKNSFNKMFLLKR